MKNEFMKRAIELSIESVKKGGGPFGCVIVKDKKIVSEGSNKVTSTNDPTAHGEIVAIREACKKLNNFKKGGFILAIRTKVPLVPIVIKGANELNKKTSFSIKPGKVQLIINSPIDSSKYSENRKEDLLKKCYSLIQKNI